MSSLCSNQVTHWWSSEDVWAQEPMCVHRVLVSWSGTGFVFKTSNATVCFLKLLNQPFEKCLKKIKYGSAPITLLTENVYSCQSDKFKCS